VRRFKKRNGAWMTSYKSQFVKTKSMKDRTSQTYVISETYNKTFLIDFNEVLFHEFGHGLHGMLANCIQVYLELQYIGIL
jgi:peptidyl-dipeptidase Dcp